VSQLTQGIAPFERLLTVYARSRRHAVATFAAQTIAIVKGAHRTFDGPPCPTIEASASLSGAATPTGGAMSRAAAHPTARSARVCHNGISWRVPLLRGPLTTEPVRLIALASEAIGRFKERTR